MNGVIGSGLAVTLKEEKKIPQCICIILHVTILYNFVQPSRPSIWEFYKFCRPFYADPDCPDFHLTIFKIQIGYALLHFVWSFLTV